MSGLGKSRRPERWRLARAGKLAIRSQEDGRERGEMGTKFLRFTPLLSLSLFSGCLDPVCDSAACLADAAVTHDAGYCLPYVDLAEPVCTFANPSRECGASRCASDDSCCFPTGACILDGLAALGSFSRCDGRPRSVVECSSNLDCLDGFCDKSADGGCSSVGICRSRTACGYCVGSNCEICSCDGTTLPSIQVACVSGLRVAHPGPCTSDSGP